MCPVYPIEDDSREILPMLRELFSRWSEARYLEPWELQRRLCSLGYTDDLVEEVEIAASIEVAHTDFDPEAGAA
jgi:hypothetical protein